MKGRIAVRQTTSKYLLTERHICRNIPKFIQSHLYIPEAIPEAFKIYIMILSPQPTLAFFFHN